MPRPGSAAVKILKLSYVPNPVSAELNEETNDGITIADAMCEGFKEIERWSVTKQGLVEAVQESYTGDRQ
jgi:hypothetical protein